MIDKNTFMPIQFFKKTDYKGSLNGLRYRIGKAVIQIPQEEAGAVQTGSGGAADKAADHAEPQMKEETVLRAIIWEGPFAYEKRDPATEYSRDFSFDREGIGEAVDWINGEYERDKDRWDNVPFWTPQMSRKWESGESGDAQDV